MKFIDEARIRVEAGGGGHGCLSFRREKFIPFGGPDGGDGGDGGSVYLCGDRAFNTLARFRDRHVWKARRGQDGSGQQRTGKTGDDLMVGVPPGTVVYDEETRELLGDIVDHGQGLKVAQGGYHGLGNTRFKSSVNRAPRRTTEGTPGEQRLLRLELRVLADVGLLGLPNAGKSTLLSVLSAARPKIADYPFTTLNPQLGVVDVGDERGFVMADIPGLIAGAASGTGLGIRFLKHLLRTRLLLHVIDIATPADPQELVVAARTVETELTQFNPELAAKPRLLVLNKTDALNDREITQRSCVIRQAYGNDGPVLTISAVQKRGLDDLKRHIMQTLYDETD